MNYTSDKILELNEQVKAESTFIDSINEEVSKILVGQKNMLNALLTALLSGGHVLLEGVPGLAKTLAIKSLSSVIDARFSRIQFTPDLLPADVIGTMIYNMPTNTFEVRKGPVFSNFILADEINRAPAKVQSALLEAMQELQVTIGDTSYKLEEPFMVLATQNPLEQEGTYPLPEAQLDRFMFKVLVNYPDKEEEKIIMRNSVHNTFSDLQKVIHHNAILKARETVKTVYVDDKIENYIVNIVFASRQPVQSGLQKITPLISYGGSPRASICLMQAAKAYAYIRHRGYVIPEDVRSCCYDVMRHRIGLTYEAEAENISADDIISEILNTVEVP